MKAMINLQTWVERPIFMEKVLCTDQISTTVVFHVGMQLWVIKAAKMNGVFIH